MAGTNEGAFRDLYDRHHRQVLAYLLRRADREDAFDAAEDVFLVAWRRLCEVPPGDRALPWLYGVARRVLANHRRSASRFARLTRRVAAHRGDRPPGSRGDARRAGHAFRSRSGGAPPHVLGRTNPRRDRTHNRLFHGGGPRASLPSRATFGERSGPCRTQTK